MPNDGRILIVECGLHSPAPGVGSLGDTVIQFLHLCEVGTKVCIHIQFFKKIIYKLYDTNCMIHYVKKMCIFEQ